MAGAPPMAGGGGEAQVQSSFPGPPMVFINKYSDEAVQRDTAPKPPPVPTGSYMMFGQQCHQDDLIIRPLEMQGLQRLHPQVYDRRKELKKFTVSILCNFLDLLDILVNATASQEREKKIEDLNLLFIHIHHLINEFRPHQARETLKVMMEMQQTQMLDVAERLLKRIDKAGGILSQSSSQLAAMQAEAGNTSDLLLMNEEEMNVDSLLNTPGCESVETGDANNSSNSAPMETDPSDVVKEIYEKDKILAGLISE